MPPFTKNVFFETYINLKQSSFIFFGANFSQQEFPEYCTCLRIYLSLTFLCCSEEADYGQLTWDESETFPWKDKTAKSWKNLGCCLQFPTNSCKKKKQISLFNKLRDINFFASLTYAFQSLIKLLESFSWYWKCITILLICENLSRACRLVSENLSLEKIETLYFVLWGVCKGAHFKGSKLDI